MTLFIEPNLPEQLKLSDGQVRRVRTILKAGEPLLEEAATFAIPLDANDRLPTPKSVLDLIASPKFQEAKRTARQAARKALSSVIRRIEEEVLTESQREAYRKRIGAPFDLARLNRPQDERTEDYKKVSAALRISGMMDVDMGYDIKVAHPAFANAVRRPRIIFDEAHGNWCSAVGEYLPFALLLTNDGYQVRRSRDKFDADLLRQGDILVIADAVRGSRPGSAPKAEYTDDECDAVRDWVRNGGALLLITDAPVGTAGGAAGNLASRFSLSMSNRLTTDPVNSEERESWLVFSRKNRLLGEHPITRGRDDSERLDRVMTFVGRSIKGPEGSVPFLKLGDTAVERADTANPRIPVADRAQGLAFTFGRGRVVAIGETTALTATLFGPQERRSRIGMNVPGIDNRQMVLNIMHWLSGLLDPREAAIQKAE